MNGADLLCEVLLANGIDTCFANPGTSEMHFVAALDRHPQMRCILGLAEGVVTGAADGFGRMADKPAATLLHLGPGLANGLANLHNARRGGTPIVNIVGDHASYHLALDAPLTSDIESLARPMSVWVGRAPGGDAVAAAAAEACDKACALGGPATMILPADAAWSDAGGQSVVRTKPTRPEAVGEAALNDAVAALQNGSRTAILLGGKALRQKPLEWAGMIAEATGARLLAETSNARIERGAGRIGIERVPYPVDLAVRTLGSVDTLLLIGSKPPVAFFAYPDKRGRLTREDCRIVPVADRLQDLPDTLARLSERVGAKRSTSRRHYASPAKEGDLPKGALSAEAVATIVARAMPEGAVVCDESVTSGSNFFAQSEQSCPHDYLQITGGAIGIGIPLATGAAIASPGRKVIGLQADGSAMYTLQGLWTQARERLDVTTIIYANRSYRILEGELRNVGVSNPGPSASRMLSIGDPSLDWVQMSRGMGVEAVCVDTAAGFQAAFTAALRQRGPFLIEAVI